MGWVSARDRVNFWLVCLLCMLCSVSGIGVNWGTQSSHSLPPDIIVNLLKDNGFQRVKLFDADYGTLKALGKSGIEVMVGIPNDMLASVGGSMKAAEKWVAKNVSAHITSNNVNIRSALFFFLFSSVTILLLSGLAGKVYIISYPYVLP